MVQEGFNVVLYVYQRKQGFKRLGGFFFNFNIPFGGIQFESFKFPETNFLQISKFEIKLRNDKYENKGLHS